MPIHFSTPSLCRGFRLDARQFLPDGVHKRVYPTLKKIKTPAFWVKPNRFTAHIQIARKDMPFGRTSALTIRVVTVLTSGRMVITLLNRRIAVHVDTRGILRTGEATQ